MEEIKKTNRRKLQELNAKIDQAMVSREEQAVDIQTRVDVQVLQAKSNAEARVLRSKAEKEVAAQQGEKKFVESVEKMKAECNAKRVLAGQDYRSRVTRAKAKLNVAERTAKAIEAEAEVEMQAGKKLFAKREFEVRKLRMDVLTGIAENGKMVICGETGEKLLQQIAPGSSNDLSVS